MTVKPFTVVIPTPVNDMNLVSHSVPENEHPIWSAETNYLLGDRVIYQHFIYESLQHPNTGNRPDISPLFWVNTGPTNRFGAFDESGGTFTTATNSIEFVVTGSRIDSFGFLDLTNINSIRIRATASSNPNYFDKTIILDDAAVVNSWYSYFTSEIKRQGTIVEFNIPSIINSTYTITLQGSGMLSIGTFVMGKAKEFGFVEYGATISTKSYGRIEEDQFGRRTRVRRGFAKRMNLNIILDRTVTDSVKKQFESLRETPALWVGADGVYEATTIYGDYRDFSIVLSFPDRNTCSVEIEGIA